MSVTIQVKRGTDAQIQTATLAIGELAFATDTKSVFTYDGVVKQLVGRAMYNTLVNRPAYGIAGRLFMDSGTGVLYMDSGSAWISLGSSSHTSLSDIGTNTHAQIDSHISAAAPHSGHAATSHTHTSSDISSGIGVKATSFTQATSSPVTLLDPPNGTVITRIVVVVDSAASAGSPTVSVGTAGDTDRDMDELDSDIKTAATYIVEPYAACGTGGDNIILTITPDSQTFSGRCYLHYVVPV